MPRMSNVAAVRGNLVSRKRAKRSSRASCGVPPNAVLARSLKALRYPFAALAQPGRSGAAPSCWAAWSSACRALDTWAGLAAGRGGRYSGGRASTSRRLSARSSKIDFSAILRLAYPRLAWVPVTAIAPAASCSPREWKSSCRASRPVALLKVIRAIWGSPTKTRPIRCRSEARKARTMSIDLSRSQPSQAPFVTA